MADEKDSTEKTISEDLVVTKYKLAGEIVNKILKTLIQSVVADASVKELCEKGDFLILEETGKVFKKEKDLKKGIAFPTCLSINNCICHFSPTKNDPDYILKDGDVVKLDLGVHIDGFIAVTAYTAVVGATTDKKVSGRKADCILAAYWAVQAALRLIKPGNGNYAVTETVQKVADAYKCKPIEGMLSHQLKQNKIDGEKTIIQNPNEAQRKEHEKCEFEMHEVYAIDVLISTGEGTGREKDTKVSIYKKTDENYQLKLKSSRGLLTEIKNKYGNMPFNLRHFEEETKARMGVIECVSHKMIEPFQVLYEKTSEFVAQFKYTVLLMPSGANLVSDLPFQPELYESEHSITDQELKKLITSDIKPSKSAKGKNKKKVNGSANVVTAAADSTTTTPTTTPTTKTAAEVSPAKTKKTKTAVASPAKTKKTKTAVASPTTPKTAAASSPTTTTDTKTPEPSLEKPTPTEPSSAVQAEA